ncbi:MAG TPA: hypothetical protein PLU71_01105 [Candidatus Dependentiae bacterium]|nr:hypothetical protein [Candidatus Dependentiae bacterium]HRQ62430.1 hypothetical protein [Candidatus Dependentiae bacterium]
MKRFVWLVFIVLHMHPMAQCNIGQLVDSAYISSVQLLQRIPEQDEHVIVKLEGNFVWGQVHSVYNDMCVVACKSTRAGIQGAAFLLSAIYTLDIQKKE